MLGRRTELLVRPLEKVVPLFSVPYGVRQFLNELAGVRKLYLGFWLTAHSVVQLPQAGMNAPQQESLSTRLGVFERCLQQGKCLLRLSHGAQRLAFQLP